MQDMHPDKYAAFRRELHAHPELSEREHNTARAIVARLHADNPEGSVIIQSDEEASTRMLVDVMDQVRLAGIEAIAIAADKKAK